MVGCPEGLKLETTERGPRDGNGPKQGSSTWALDRDRQTGPRSGSSLLPTAERAVGQAGVRRLCRGELPEVLRRGHGPAVAAARGVLSAVVDRLLRGYRLGAWDRLGGGRLAGGAGGPGPLGGRG